MVFYILIVFILLFSFIFIYKDMNKNREVKQMEYQPEDVKQNQELPNIGQQMIMEECQNGAEEICYTKKGCRGKRICISGIWSECYENKICQPGKKVICLLDGCNFGYKTCNECGDGWSECLPK